MKNQRQIYLILAMLLAGLAGWWLWRASRPSEKAPIVAGPEPAVASGQKDAALPPSTSIADRQAVGGTSAVADELPDAPELTAAQKAILRQDPSAVARYAMFAQMRSESNSKRIDLYGKVVDQHGQPIPGVRIKGSVLLVVSPISSGNKEVSTETDAAGKFQFVGLRGADFGVLLEKAGYEYNGGANWTDAYKPDPRNPLVFTMWKLQGQEPMAHAAVEGRVPYDGRTAVFDLLSGRKDERGDLRVTLVRSPLNVKRGVDHFDWNVRIEVSGGGLMEAPEDYPYLAPEAGYQTAVLFAHAKNDPAWTQRLTKTFYVRRANGQYGRIEIDLTTDSERPDTGIGLETWVNLAGSRNLEFDPTKATSPRR